MFILKKQEKWPQSLIDDTDAEPNPDGWNVICLPCSRVKRMPHTLKMKNRFSGRSWEIHCEGKKHTDAVNEISGTIIPCKNDQNKLTTFGFIAPKIRSTPKPKRKAGESVQTTINTTNPTTITKKLRPIICTGILSDVYGTDAIAKLIKLKKYCIVGSEYYTFRPSLSIEHIPVLQHPKCTGIGDTIVPVRKVGRLMMCKYCAYSRKLKGKYQVNSMVKLRLKGFTAAIDSENITHITYEQYNDMKSLKHTLDKSLTLEGKDFKASILYGCNYYEELRKLKNIEQQAKKKLNQSNLSPLPSKLPPPSSFGPLDKLISVDSFLRDFVTMYNVNPEFRTSIAVCFVKGVVKKLNSKSGQHMHEHKVIMFSN